MSTAETVHITHHKWQSTAPHEHNRHELPGISRFYYWPNAHNAHPCLFGGFREIAVSFICHGYLYSIVIVCASLLYWTHLANIDRNRYEQRTCWLNARYPQTLWYVVCVAAHTIHVSPCTFCDDAFPLWLTGTAIRTHLYNVIACLHSPMISVFYFVCVCAARAFAKLQVPPTLLELHHIYDSRARASRNNQIKQARSRKEFAFSTSFRKCQGYNTVQWWHAQRTLPSLTHIVFACATDGLVISCTRATKQSRRFVATKTASCNPFFAVCVCWVLCIALCSMRT